jgi:hypothetical protein
VDNYPLGYLTSLIAGFEGLYRFPVLQYLPILLIGIYAGKLIDKDYQYKHKRFILLWLTAMILAVTLVITIRPEYSAFPFKDQLSRWPPSIGFLSIGLSTGLTLIVYLTSVGLPALLERLFTSLGERALSFFTAHIILYELIDLAFPTFTTHGPLEAILIFFGSILICHFLIKLWDRPIPQSAAGLNNHPKKGIITIGLLMENNHKKIKKRLRIFFVFIVILSTILVGILWILRCQIVPDFSCGGVLDQTTLSENSNKDKNVLGESIAKDAEIDKAIWWNGEYAYSQNLKITNTSSDNMLPKGSIVSAEFNHLNLVSQNKSAIDGKDLKLIYISNGEYIEVPLILTGANATNSIIAFELISDLSAGTSDDHYCLYYGNRFVTEPDFSNISPAFSNTPYTVSFDDEESNPVVSTTNRKWILKDTVDYSNLELTVQIKDNTINIERVMYEIEDTAIEDNLQKDKDSQYSTLIDISDLEPGTYKLKSYIITENGVRLYGTAHEFIVSYPLYVTWSIDWEGMDTSDATLKAMDDFSNKYQTPIIQLWNPRAHIALSKTRLNKLLEWIKARQAKGDEIGLHLHMFTDMVKAAGVTAQNTPNWAAERNKSGSDTPAYVYSYEEHVQIFDWAKAQFALHGLNTPKIYRAGGWMADENLLRALNDTGFAIDTSGRTKFSFGEYLVRYEGGIRKATESEIQLYLAHQVDPSVDISSLPEFIEYKVDGKWELSVDAHPYKISEMNMNLDTLPTLSLWEFPNNGADSWHFGTAELIKRFDINFNGNPLKEAQVLTYLSHPHAIQVDIKKLDPTYSHINQYTAKSDQGPVIYSTFKEPYEYLTGETY